MSPSPNDNLARNAVRSYSDSWRATLKLVRSGFSWSGHERNCVFLNCTDANVAGETRFANASAISGLDFPDDGRALAVVDWDGDGDLDLWLRNRTAPRLRLMRNLTDQINPSSKHISIRLTGTTSNRDAIGARVELDIRHGDQHQQMVRSIRAGDAFLSQSTQEIHIGMPATAAVERLTIFWPGGQRELIRGVEPGFNYEITQGSGQARKRKPRQHISLKATPNVPPPLTAAARIILPGRVPFPPIRLRLDGHSDLHLYRPTETPTLIVFWSQSCENCRRELTELSNRYTEFQQAGLNVLAICLDGLEASDDNHSKQSNETRNAFLAKIEFPFPSATTTVDSVDLLNAFQNALFSQSPTFVVPLSLMVDADGQVICIYRGSFSPQTFQRDRGLANLDDVDLRTLSTPLVGTWITKPATRSQFAEFVASKLLAVQPRAAMHYYQAAMNAESNPAAKEVLQDHIRQLQQVLLRGSER